MIRRCLLGALLALFAARAPAQTVTGPAPGGLTLISTQSPAGSAAVTFSNIPQNFTDLVIVVRGSTASASAFSEIDLQFNADNASHYSQQNIEFNNATGSSGGSTGTQIFAGWLPAANGIANDASSVEATIYNYSSTTAFKSVESMGGLRTSAAASGFFALRTWAMWNGAAAVTSITVFMNTNSANFNASSSVSLYGRN